MHMLLGHIKNENEKKSAEFPPPHLSVSTMHIEQLVGHIEPL